jgi:hypothetical protein
MLGLEGHELPTGAARARQVLLKIEPKAARAPGKSFLAIAMRPAIMRVPLLLKGIETAVCKAGRLLIHFLRYIQVAGS